MNKLIIGFGGLKFAGKTTAAKVIYNMFAEECELLSFATPVKAACKDLFLLTDEQMNVPILKEQIDYRWNKTPRQLMQLLGTDFVRKMVADNFWVKRLADVAINSNKRVIIIDDVRFDEECRLCDYAFMIHRKNQCITDNHESENPPYHLAFSDIINDFSSVADFERHIRASLPVKIVQEYLNGSKN